MSINSALTIPENEEKANRIVSYICVIMSVFILVYFLMVRFMVIETHHHAEMYGFLLLNATVLMVVMIVYALSDGKTWWIKYMQIAAVMVTSLMLAVMMGSNYLIFVLPLVLCIFYNRVRFSMTVSAICGLFILLEPFISFYVGDINYNFVSMEAEYDAVVIIGYGMPSIINQLQEYTIPCFIIFIAISMLAIWMTDLGFKHAYTIREAAIKEVTIEKEMSIASDIQRGMLPEGRIEGEEFSVSAEMLSAKSVGGDFYDFIHVDDSHVALVVADVSGKGMPASLFMASAKASLRSNLAGGFQTDEVMKRTNSVLCDSNREKLFVTAWLGIIDLETGRMSYVNAGHNPPFLIHNGKVEKLVDRPDFILGRKRRIQYNEHRITLELGDKLVLYTDGVTEAVGPDGSMYGENRLTDVLSRSSGSAEEFRAAIEKDVNEFVNGVERSDDITIMVFELDKLMTDEGEFKDFSITQESFEEVMGYIRSTLEGLGCPANVIRDMEICSSEILSNIDMYAYQGKGGELGVSASIRNRRAKIVFRDKGPEYNPLLKDNPDIEMRIKDHKVGGFGLFIVRKMMDEVKYDRIDDYNMLTIKRGF